MKRTKLFALTMAIVFVLAMFAGCSKNNTESSSGSDALASSTQEDSSSDETSDDAGDGGNEEEREFVKLKFYIANSPVTDYERVMEKANAIIKEEINAELEFIMIDGGTYAEKINLMIGSGEEFDLCFMAFWGGYNFVENASKGAFVDLTELLPKYAPVTYARVPDSMWEGVTLDNHIYASVNYQQWGSAARKGYAVRMDIAEEAGFDWQALKDKPALEALRMLEPLLEFAKTNHPEMIGWETSATYSFFANEPLYWDMESVGDLTMPGWLRFTEPDTIINQFATEEFEEYCNIMRDWYNAGYVRSDGATLQDTSADRKANKMVAAAYYGWPDYIDFAPTGVEELTIKGFEEAGYTPDGMSMTQAGEAPAGLVSTTRTYMPATAGSNACTAISATSKNPERCVELIELLNTNDELFNLIQWGEEGVDWEYNEDGDFINIEGMYNFNWNDWQIGHSYSETFARSDFGLGKTQKQKDQMEKLKIVYDADENADPSPVAGFEFDPSPVKTELSNCSAIIEEMVPTLSNGAVDPSTALPSFLERLEGAGVDRIIAEKQAQYDEWRNS